MTSYISIRILRPLADNEILLVLCSTTAVVMSDLAAFEVDARIDDHIGQIAD